MFQSLASNLVPGDTNGEADVFVHDRQTGQTKRVSVASDGSQANGWSRWVSMSSDGHLIGFSSTASNLVPEDSNGRIDAFVTANPFSPPPQPPPNRPPRADDMSLGTDEDEPVSTALLGSDPDGDPLSFVVVSLPIHGELADGSTVLTFTPFTLTDRAITYTPAVDYFGSDAFTFKTNDGTLDSNVASVTIVVMPVNDPPDCSNAEPSIDLIWPPDHEFRRVQVRGVTDPEGGVATVFVSSILQDEPVDTFGDGRFTPDGRGVGTDTAELRAERSGTKKVSGNGRVYHVDFTADDGNGGLCSGTISVGVPFKQGQRAAPVDDGSLYDSTLP